MLETKICSIAKQTVVAMVVMAVVDEQKSICIQ